MKRRLGVAVFLVLSTLLAAPAMADRDVHRHPGYRARPHDPHRHYEHHEYGGRRYVYRGHWRSWEAWERYYRAHPHLHGRGHYYHDHVHLMYRYCDPDGSCFFFSIGR